MQHRDRLACPHCGSERTHGHGSFPREDGTREPRWLCRACGRTFCAQTGTPACYLKKRQQWQQMPQEMAQHKTVRGLALVLGVRPATIFAWRHRLLGTLCQHPQPVLTGEVVLTKTLVRYSEKGSRRSGGPGAWGSRIRPRRFKPFRRFIDGKPSCVLVACSNGRLHTAIAGQGLPAPAVLHAALGPMLMPGCAVWTAGISSLDEACHQLGCKPPGVPRMGILSSPFCAAYVQSGDLRAWLGEFRGVATRYLSHYLAWFRHECQAAAVASAA